jgi:hypothetical protein
MTRTEKVIKSGIGRIILGSFCTILIWHYLLNDLTKRLSLENVFQFAFCSAIALFSMATALSGILVLITRFPYPELSDKWDKQSGFAKILILVIGSICFYIIIFFIGLIIYN